MFMISHSGTQCLFTTYMTGSTSPTTRQLHSRSHGTHLDSHASPIGSRSAILSHRMPSTNRPSPTTSRNMRLGSPRNTGQMANSTSAIKPLSLPLSRVTPSSTLRNLVAEQGEGAKPFASNAAASSITADKDKGRRRPEEEKAAAAAGTASGASVQSDTKIAQTAPAAPAAAKTEGRSRTLSDCD